MITIQTYYLEPFIAANAKTEPLSTQWLREAISKLIRSGQVPFEKAGADPSYFYNHDPKTEQTRIGYPLIIYHYIDGVFYLVGINDGAKSLALLAKHYKSPFSVDGVVFQGFKKVRGGGEFDLSSTAEPRLYRMTEWLPLHHKDLKAFRQTDMVAKVTELNKKLEKHITGELGKYLAIGFENLCATITDITQVYPQPVIYKGYEYLAFDIRFTANVSLPPMITLGNNKALGFGRVEPN